jgi:hypothetical protein
MSAVDTPSSTTAVGRHHLPCVHSAIPGQDEQGGRGEGEHLRERPSRRGRGRRDLATRSPRPHLFGATNRFPTGQRGIYAYWRTGTVVAVANSLRYLEVL